MDIKRTLTTIGKSTFVKYYYNFKHLSTEECIDKFEESYTLKSKKSRTGHAKMIFNHNMHLEALQIIADSEKTDLKTLEKTLEIMKNELATLKFRKH